MRCSSASSARALARCRPGQGKGKIALDVLEVEKAAELLGPDSARMLLLQERLAKDIEEGELGTLAADVEFPLVHVLA